MSTEYDVMLRMRTVIEADAAIDTWATTNFGKSLTVLIGNRKLSGQAKIRPEQIPCVAIVCEPGSVTAYSTGNFLAEDYSLGTVLLHNDIELAVKLQAELMELICIALIADRKIESGGALGELLTNLELSERLGDQQVNHPHHFNTFMFTASRSAGF